LTVRTTSSHRTGVRLCCQKRLLICHKVPR
jgi:hypothetical protein